MKGLKKYAAIGTLALATLAGCRPAPNLEENMPEANGYDVMVHYNDEKSSAAEIRIGTYEGNGNGFSELIYAVERDGDGRVDEVKLLAPKGSPLESLASVSKVDEIFAKFQEKNKR
jgi:hypothetical protein